MTKKIKFIIYLFLLLFSFVGIFYYSIFYSAFGIEIWNFFSFQDYLKGSVNVVYVSIIGMIIGLLFIHIDAETKKILGIDLPQASKTSDDDNIKTLKDVYKEASSIKNYYDFVLISAISLFLFLISINLVKSPLRYFFLSMFLCFAMCIIYGMFIKFRIFFYFYSKDKTDTIPYVWNAIDSILLVIFLTYGFSATSADLIKNMTLYPKINISFKSEINLDQDHSILLGSSKDYLFLYDYIKRNSYVIPRSEVHYITQSPKEENVLDEIKTLIGKRQILKRKGDGSIFSPSTNNHQ